MHAHQKSPMSLTLSQVSIWGSSKGNNQLNEPRSGPVHHERSNNKVHTPKNVVLGIVFSDGPLWKTQRRFSLHHLRNFGFGRKQMEEKIQDECKAFVEKLNEKCNSPVFMHNAFDISVLNALWAMLAGESLKKKLISKCISIIIIIIKIYPFEV